MLGCADQRFCIPMQNMGAPHQQINEPNRGEEYETPLTASNSKPIKISNIELYVLEALKLDLFGQQFQVL
jgi:hypothetical protein